jgi:type IV pilus assembly protein PilY1
MGMAAAAYGLAAASAGTPVELAQTPLFLTLGVKPNIMLALDDSGSMDAEVLMESNDGAMWWHTGDQSFVGRDINDALAGSAINFNRIGDASSTWQKYIYLFPNGTGTGRRIYRDEANVHYAVPPLPGFAFARSPVFNFGYFDPAVVYAPWPSLGSYTFGDANPTSAPTDPTRGSATFDLTSQREEANSADFLFRLQPGMVIPAGTRYRDWNASNAWTTAAADIVLTSAANSAGASGRSVAISYFPATFYLPASTSLPAGFGYLPGAVVADATAPTGEILNRFEIRPENFATPEAYAAAIQNFANWFTYYRKRHLAARGALGIAFGDITNLRVGTFVINNRTTVTMRDLGVTADRNAFFNQAYTSMVNNAGTPNREAVRHMGEQLRRTGAGAPIQFPCQQNFGLLFTDGYASAWTGAGVGNVDGSYGAPFADTVLNTMADIAMFYYQTNLRPDLPPGRVPVPAACSAANPALSLDCQTNLHMNLFALTLGTPGTIFKVDPAATEDPYKNPPSWPTAFTNRNPVHVDDLWHATLNSRGVLLDVTVPSELGQRFRSILQAIAERTSSASSVATNSTRLTSDTFIYQARFSSADWTGQFLAFPILPDGRIGNLAWDAASLIAAPNARNLLTYDPAASLGSRGRDFLWETLTAAQQLALDTRADAVVDGLGAARLGYLRGERGNEGLSGLRFRPRTTLLGDIVNSDPLFVGQQDYGFDRLPGIEGSSYIAFRKSAAYQGRPTMVYVGANDGKLHGFDGVTGVERFAYVPNAVIGGLSRLTSPAYNADHRYILDGSPRALDAYLSGGWKTILLGSLGAGGAGLFALDVTNPASFGGSSVMWEFTSADDADLGATIPQPVIARLNNGQWAAIAANGYNSAGGRALLLIIDLQTGTVLRKIDTLAGDHNGLSSPAPVDVDGDRITDFVYAGDLKGNLWKFDLTSPDPAEWKVAFGTPANPEPLYTACSGNTCTANNRQPIQARPEVGAAPDGGFLVYFGTGRYFASGDNTLAGVSNTFYAIRDYGDKGVSGVLPPTVGRASLLQQSVISEQAVTVGQAVQPVRVTTDFANDASYKGWYLDLPATGERQVSTPLLRAGRVIFTTLIPNTDPCSFGGTSWLMELDALSGSRLASSPFDLNRDFEFNADDFVVIMVEEEEVAVPVSGRQSLEGIIKTPGIITDGSIEYKFASGSSGGIDTTIESAGEQRGRQSWRQIQ